MQKEEKNDPANFEMQKTLAEVEMQRKLKNGKKKLKALQFSLEECLKWPQTYHEGLLLQANLYRWEEGAKTLVVEDWEQEQKSHEIVLKPSLSRQKEISIRFNESKRQKHAIGKVEIEIVKAEKAIEGIQKLLEELACIEDEKALEAFKKRCHLAQQKKAPTKQERKALPYRVFISSSGRQILVGKRAQDNETLTFKVANGSDYWLHVQGYSGSHVIIKSIKGKEVDPATVQEAAQLAMYYSKAKEQGHADVVVTQQKYVSRFGKGGGNVGKVQISQHRMIYVKQDKDLIHRLEKN